MHEFEMPTQSKEKDYSHRTTVQKLGVAPGDRIEVQGDVGPGLRKDVKEASGRGLVKTGELDGAIVAVNSLDEAQGIFATYRGRIKDSGYLWLITRKRGHENYMNQMLLVPFGKACGMIDNKTCSVDDTRSGIRFVVPRAKRRSANGAGEAAP